MQDNHDVTVVLTILTVCLISGIYLISFVAEHSRLIF